MPESKRHTFSAAHLPADIGAELLSLRVAARWSQAKLSKASGVPRETIARIETAKRQPLSDTVLRLLEVLLALFPDKEMQEIVPNWPEADPRQVIGHGPRSRARRRQLKLSGLEVAAKAGVHPSTLSRFERNAGPTPSLLRKGVKEDGDIIFTLVKEELATALSFKSLEDHEKFCNADALRPWPVNNP